MQTQKFQELVEKYLEESASIDEKRQLATFLEDSTYLALLDNMLVDQLTSNTYEFEPDQAIQCSIDQYIEQRTLPLSAKLVPAAHRVRFLRKWGWAAAVIFVLGSAAYFWTASKKTEQTLANGNKPLPTDILPGSNKAILTLSNGKTITLDSAANGAIAQEGNSSITKLANGGIRYDLKGLAQGEVMMNTMTTPRGGQYQLILPDGTKVWLNAASSITYPAVFVGNERKVMVTGEVYMEVAQNKSKPFFVDVNGKSTVQVLGTSFNINSYADEENIKTTLIDGSVKVISNGTNLSVSNKSNETNSAVAGSSDRRQDSENLSGVILKPGQQAIYNQAEGLGSSTKLRVINDIDIEQTLAWKNGVFNLEGSDIHQLMRQIERWYDVEVRYEGTIPDLQLKGEIDRGVKLSGITRFLSDYGFITRLEGRRLILRTP